MQYPDVDPEVDRLWAEAWEEVDAAVSEDACALYMRMYHGGDDAVTSVKKLTDHGYSELLVRRCMKELIDKGYVVKENEVYRVAKEDPRMGPIGNDGTY